MRMMPGLTQVLSLVLLLLLRPSSGRTVLASSSATFLGAQRLEQPAGGTLSYAAHGTDWQDGSCSSRVSQSPISLDTSLKEPSRGFFEYFYEPITDASLKMLANRSALSIDLTSALGAAGGPIGGVRHNKALYQLERVDIKGPSEHMLAGERFALELQLVHREVGVHNPGGYVIVSVLVWCEKMPRPPDPAVPTPPFVTPGSAQVDFNANLQPLVTNEPPQAEGGSAALGVTPQAPLDLGMFLENRNLPPAARKPAAFMVYSGSLSAPPCEETATWLVRREAIFASGAQVAALAGPLFSLTAGQGSYRDVMPLNRRRPSPIAPSFSAAISQELSAAASTGAPGAAPPMPPGPSLPWGPNPRTDKEFGAAMTAKVKMDDAKKLAEEAKALANTLAAGERAYAQKMHPPKVKAVKKEESAKPGLGPAVEKAVGTLAVRGDPVVLKAAEEAAKAHVSDELQNMASMLRGESARQAKITTQMLKG